MTLEERFIEFARNLKSAEIVDELNLSQEQNKAKKPDFFFFERQFIGEMKSIKKDMKPKVQAILDKHKDRPEFPVFFGEWDSNKILKHLPDGDSINKEMLEAATTALEDHVEKANRQIREAKKVFEIIESEGILIVLNDCIEILSPDLMVYKIHQLLKKKDRSGNARYPDLSVVWVISETHTLKTEMGQEFLPCIVIVNDYSPSYQEANKYVSWLQRKWASFNNIPFFKSTFADIPLSEFSGQKEISSSEMIPRSEIWKKQYLRTPYLRHLDKEELLIHFQKISSETMPAFLRGTHEKPSQVKVNKLMEIFTHFIEEINYRGIDFREFSPKLQEVFETLQKEGKLKLEARPDSESEKADDLFEADSK
jgi:hypothetical protein